MAKLSGPLFSLSASGKIADALVYFTWKGLDVVRSYVIPANPKTAGQTTQRDHLTEAVTAVHDAQADAVNPLGATDVAAYALWASVVKAATTWFNQVVKSWIDQQVAGLDSMVCSMGLITPGATTLTFRLRFPQVSGIAITDGFIWYGTSKTALINSLAATAFEMSSGVAVTGLTTGTKYYLQYRPTLPVEYVGCRSGIYYGVPT